MMIYADTHFITRLYLERPETSLAGQFILDENPVLPIAWLLKLARIFHTCLLWLPRAAADKCEGVGYQGTATWQGMLPLLPSGPGGVHKLVIRGP